MPQLHHNSSEATNVIALAIGIQSSVCRKFPRETLAHILCIDRSLLLQDKFFLLRLICGCETLPLAEFDELTKAIPVSALKNISQS